MQRSSTRTNERPDPIARLNKVIRRANAIFTPPEALTVSEWADKKRVLPATASESGHYRTSRTPYLKEPMDAFTDPRIHKIVVVAASQVGKSEFELNAIGYIIDQDPGTILYIHPSLEEARKFSRQRLAPMIADCKVLKAKVSDVKAKDSGNTILQKTFPGGSITLIGSNTPRALASTPVRYVIGDEHDRWSRSAGKEGDPWKLAERRQTTFYNRKSLDISTPPVKGASPIEDGYYEGTQERWCHLCPDCGEYSEIDFDDIKFEPVVTKVGNKKIYKLNGPVYWCCPKCGCLQTEDTMRQQPAKWIAVNPEAYERGIKSYWLNAFSSPWTPWAKIVLEFLEAKDDPLKLQVVFNTLLGKLWEERGDLADEDTLLARREDYAAELPDGVLVLTCGVDVQDNRLEYEVVGHGHYGETWGIRRGMLMGSPDTAEPWGQLDDIIQHVYKFRSGRGLRISITLVDSGGHYTQEVYEACRARQPYRVFASKGRGGEGIPYTTPPSRVPIRENKNVTCWLYNIGVDAGKAMIMSNLKVGEPGAKYCHFPLQEAAGYDSYFFNGLLSEKLVLASTKRGKRWQWEILPGHKRNEPLDCRNYALAGLRIINPDMDAIERRLKGIEQPQPQATQAPQRRRGAHRRDDSDDEW